MSFFLSSSFILLLLRLTSCMILLFHLTNKFSKCQLFIIQKLFPFPSCRSSRTHDFCFVVHVCLTDIPKFLDPGRKCWTLDSGLWNLGTGLWTLHSGSWALDAGLRVRVRVVRIQTLYRISITMMFLEIRTQRILSNLIKQIKKLELDSVLNQSVTISSPVHLLAIRGRRKEGFF